MKKIFVLQLLASTALLSAFNACSGGGSGNVAPILPGTASVGGAYAGCSGTGINSEMSCQSYEVTSDKRAEYQKYCSIPGGYSQHCKFALKGAESFAINLGESGDPINGATLPILNPNTQNGGLPTGITVYPGDLFTLVVADGHYSAKHSSIESCSNDISFEGNDSEANTIFNPSNGMHAGAYMELVDVNGVRSGFQAVGRNPVKITVPGNGSQNNPLSVVIGYNASAMSCGDIKVSYRIKRCLDNSLNTYDCSKL